MVAKLSHLKPSHFVGLKAYVQSLVPVDWHNVWEDGLRMVNLDFLESVLAVFHEVHEATNVVVSEASGADSFVASGADSFDTSGATPTTPVLPSADSYSDSDSPIACPVPRPPPPAL